MIVRSCLPMMVLTSLTLFATRCYSQEVAPHPLSFSMVAKTDFFQWHEYSDANVLLVQDLGNLWGGGVQASYLLNRRWMLSLEAEYFKGTATYKGYTFSQGIPQTYTQTNGYSGWSGILKAGYVLASTPRFTIRATAGLQARCWLRDLLSYSPPTVQSTRILIQLEYNEGYRMLMPQLGLDATYSLGKFWSVAGTVAVSYPVHSREYLLFDDPASLAASFQVAAQQNPLLQPAVTYDWSNVYVTNGKNLNPLLEASVKFKQYGTFIRFQQFNLGRSNDTGGVSIHQPASVNKILTVGIQVMLKGVMQNSRGSEY